MVQHNKWNILYISFALIVTNSLSRETVDKADDIKCCVVPPPGLWNSFHDQFYRHLLSRIQSHSICYNGELEKFNYRYFCF